MTSAEIARLKDCGEVCGECNACLKADHAVLEGHVKVLNAELTRSRAAHLENAELLAKANAEVEQANRSIENLNGQLDNAHRERLAAVALNTPHERRWRSLMALGEEALRHAGDALDRIARENEQHPHRAAFNRLAHWLWRACGAEPDDAAVTGTPSDKRAIRQPETEQVFRQAAIAAVAYLAAHSELVRAGISQERPDAARRLADAWIALNRACAEIPAGDAAAIRSADNSPKEE